MTGVRVRMYRQGLGDCFLLTFGTGADPVHVLVDCGVLKGTPDAAAKLVKVAESVCETTDRKLDVLVVTHEHWDHVSGFLQARTAFETLAVQEVWLAWTEDPADELAQELRVRKARALRAVSAAAARMRGAVAAPLNALLELHGDLGAAGGQTTATGLAWAKSRPSATVRYLRPGALTGLPGLDGVRVYVLGPPHDRAQIKRSDPSRAHSEVYELLGDNSPGLGFLAALEPENGLPGAQPFDEWFRVSDDEARDDPFFSRHYGASRSAWRTIEHDWLGVAGSLALQLDSDTNNTSLVLAFELPDGRVLLFPGDAQVGNWLSWGPLEWTTEGGALVQSGDLLARTVLYKVGHHGSHNATLREQGLELMASGELAAMIPVNRVTAQKKRWNMPFPPLHKRLVEKTQGRILDAELGLSEQPAADLSPADWTGFTGRVDVQEHWIDYTIDW